MKQRTFLGILAGGLVAEPLAVAVSSFETFRHALRELVPLSAR